MDKGDQFQVTYLGLVVHGFTHIDSPRHMVPQGPTTSEVGLERVAKLRGLVLPAAMRLSSFLSRIILRSLLDFRP